MEKLNIFWLAHFNIRLIEHQLSWRKYMKTRHPTSWISVLAAELGRRDDVSLHIFTETPYVRGLQTTDWQGIPVTVIPSGIPWVGRSWPPNWPIDVLMGFPYERFRLARALSRMQRPDLIHVHGTEHFYGLVAQRRGVPWIVSIQGIMEACNTVQPCRRFRWMRRWERRIVRSATAVFCRTQFDREFVHSLNPVARVFDVPEAMGPEFFAASWTLPPGRRILYLGGDLHLKGPDLLLKAIAQVSDSVPGVHLDFVGTAREPIREQVRNLSAQHPLSVEFHGSKTAQEIAQLHRICRVFVLPSRMDNSPNALAEAMVSGMPCVAFAVGGVPSMVQDGVTGLLVPPGDVRGLADAIARVLTDDALAIRVGKAAATVARARHAPSAVADQVMAAYRQILAHQEQRTCAAGISEGRKRESR